MDGVFAKSTSFITSRPAELTARFCIRFPLARFESLAEDNGLGCGGGGILRFLPPFPLCDPLPFSWLDAYASRASD